MKTMSNLTKALIAIALILVLTISWFFMTKNSFVTLKEDADMQQSQVETALQRRNDLIPNLVSTVKGYATHEEKVFTEIAEARAKLSGSIENGNIEDISEANNNLSSAINRLLVITENYPELKANEQFTALQDELAGTENRISVARQYYNEKVKTYNSKIKRFPSSIVAGMSGYSPMKYFEADASAKKAPVVNFE